MLNADSKREGASRRGRSGTLGSRSGHRERFSAPQLMELMVSSSDIDSPLRLITLFLKSVFDGRKRCRQLQPLRAPGPMLRVFCLFRTKYSENPRLIVASHFPRLWPRACTSMERLTVLLPSYLGVACVPDPANARQQCLGVSRAPIILLLRARKRGFLFRSAR
jgi:hypothetical protein